MRLLVKAIGYSLSGDEVCLDAWRQGSCEPFVKTIFEPADSFFIRSCEPMINTQMCLYLEKSGKWINGDKG